MHKSPETRRAFLKSAAVASAAAATVSRKTFAAPEGDTYFAGAAEREITPPEGMEITHFVRENIGVHDPLFVRALVLSGVLFCGRGVPGNPARGATGQL